MNAVGAIGNFLINNQVMIEALLLILLAAIVIYWLVRKVVTKNSGKNKIVEELQGKVEELESKLRNLEKESTVDSHEEPTEEQEEVVPEERLIFEEVANEELPESLEETIDIRKLMLENEELDSIMDKPITRFSDRNWGEDKHGNLYTEEDLRNQIN